MHKWLTHKPVFLGETRPNLLVKDFIDDVTRKWDRDKVFDLFAYKTRMEILQVPCQGCPQETYWSGRNLGLNVSLSKLHIKLHLGLGSNKGLNTLV